MDGKPNVKVIFCDGVAMKKTENGIDNSFVNVYEELRPYNVPGNFTFNLVLMISEIDYSTVKNISVLFSDPNDSPVFKIDSLPLPLDLDMTAKNRIQITIDCRNVIFKEEGLHKVTVYFNDEAVCKENISVIKGSD